MRIRACGWLTLCCAAALLTTCDPGPPTGSAALTLTFNAPANDRGLRGQLSGVVDGIRVTVRDASGPLVQDGFDYEDYQGIVEEIPAGSNRIFEVQALAGTEVAYAGSVSGITIVANQQADVAVSLDPAYTDDVYAPAAVTDLAAQASGANVILSWTSSGDDGLVGQAASYDLRWSESAIGQSNFDSATPVAGVGTPRLAQLDETFTVEGLTPGGTYHFAIRVVDDAGNPSAVSNDAVATTGGPDAIAPGDIDDLRVYAVSESSVTLAWTAPGDDGLLGTVTIYDVRFGDADITDDIAFAAASPFDWPVEVTPVVGGQTQLLEVTGLITRQTYYFAVKAADEVPNWSNLSTSTSATPPDQTGPAAVTNLADSSVMDDSVTLTWSAPADRPLGDAVASYEIRYSQAVIDADNFSSATLWSSPPTPQAPGQTETVTISPLTFDQRYTFALISYDLSGNPSDLSTVATATPGQQDTTAPARVTDLGVDQVTETSVVLTWTAPGDDGAVGTVSAYDVRYSTADITNEATFASATPFAWPASTTIVSAGSPQTVEVTGLTTDQPYFFALTATDNSANESAVSNSTPGTPADLIDPGDIVDLTVTDHGDETITLSWTAPGDDGATGTVTDYDIRVSLTEIPDETAFDAAPAFAWPGGTPIVEGGQTQAVVVDGRSPGTLYYIRLRALDEAGNRSSLSGQVSQQTTCSLCPVVDRLRPITAPVGARLVVEGSSFGSNQGTSTLTVGAQPATVLAWSDSRIEAQVPAGVTGVAQVEVSTDAGPLTGTGALRVTPYITSITPNTVPGTGVDITIDGSGFGDTQGSSIITFFKSANHPTPSWSDTSITVTIPGDAQTGPISVTVDGYDSNTPMLTIGTGRTWSTPPAEHQGNTNPSLTPQAAANPQGEIQVAWAEVDTVADQQIWGRAYLSAIWTAPDADANISATTADSSMPEVLFDGNADFFVLWTDDGGSPSLRARRGKGLEGTSNWDDGEEIAAEGSGGRLAAGLLPDGRLVVAWAAPDGQAARFAIRDVAGAWSSAGDVATGTTNTTHIAGAVDPGGFFHVLFVDGTSLVHRTYDGTNWSSSAMTVAALSVADPSQVQAALSADSMGRLYAVWWDDGSYDSSVNESSQAIGTWSAATALPGAAKSTSGWLDLAVDRADVVHAVVEQESAGPVYDILYFSRSPSGAWSDPGETLSTTTPGGDAYTPGVVVTEDLIVRAVWSEADFILMSEWK